VGKKVVVGIVVAVVVVTILFSVTVLLLIKSLAAEFNCSVFILISSLYCSLGEGTLDTKGNKSIDWTCARTETPGGTEKTLSPTFVTIVPAHRSQPGRPVAPEPP
jgi:hypothetical protein